MKQCCLGDGISQIWRAHTVTGDRAYIDDTTVFGGAHMGRDARHHLPWRGKVYFNRFVQLFWRRLLNVGSMTGAASIIDKNVDTLIDLQHAIDDAFRTIDIGSICANEYPASDLCGQLSALRIATGEKDRGSLTAKRFNNLETNSVCSAGDNGGLPREPSTNIRLAQGRLQWTQH